MESGKSNWTYWTYWTPDRKWGRMSEATADGKQLVTLTGFADIHRISYRTVLRLKKRGAIPIYRTVAGIRTEAGCHILSQAVTGDRKENV
jgi:hypothetical protein